MFRKLRSLRIDGKRAPGAGREPVLPAPMPGSPAASAPREGTVSPPWTPGVVTVERIGASNAMAVRAAVPPSNFTKRAKLLQPAKPFQCFSRTPKYSLNLP